MPRLFLCFLFIASPGLRADLIGNARAKLKMTPLTVIEKKIVPPSGDKRDYLSIAPYFWPDPSKPDGIPYLRKDGRVNPDARNEASDNYRMNRMLSAISTLSAAYQKSKDEAFARQASLLIRAWFLDPKTGMKPNLNFAQGIPGKVDGRCFGIIEGINLLKAARASTQLEGSPHWTDQDDKSLRDWMNQYLEWLLNSPLGKEESSRENNHGTCFDLQVVRLANFLGREEVSKRILSGVAAKRIDVQIMPDGSQPEELKRTKSLDYSRLNLKFLTDLAREGAKYDIDLWNYQSKDGRSIRKALDFLAPLLQGPRKDWPYQQIGSSKPSKFVDLYKEAAEIYRDPKYLLIAAELRKNKGW